MNARFRVLLLATFTLGFLSIGCNEKGANGKTESAPDSQVDPATTNGKSSQTVAIQPKSDSSSSRRSELQSKLQQLTHSGEFQAAAELIFEAAEAESQATRDDYLKAYTWSLRAWRYEYAERVLRSYLSRAPTDLEARHLLAALLAAQGRGFEAAAQLQTILRQGEANQQHLLLLVDVDSPTLLVDFAELTGSDNQNLTAGSRARVLLEDHDAIPDALAIVNELRDSYPDVVAYAALQGLLIAKNSPADLSDWLQKTPDKVESFPEYWQAIAIYLKEQNELQLAAGAAIQSYRLDPSNRDALRLLVAVFQELGLTDPSDSVREHLALLDKIFRTASAADPEQAVWIAHQLEKALRHWEALHWYRHAYQLTGHMATYQEQLNDRAEKIRKWNSRLDADQLSKLRVESNLGVRISDYPPPTSKDLRTSGDKVAQKESENKAMALKSVPISWREVGEKVGLSIPFVSEYPLDRVEFFLHQANGGGLATFDYDNDGHCDLYMTQTGGDPRTAASSVANQLFRNIGERFEDHSSLAGVDDRGYGQGVAAADVNQDGWLDLVIANIGSNVLFINQGDGTYRRDEKAFQSNPFSWTSDIVVGDLNGDMLPDLVEVNYLNDPAAFDVKCIDKKIHCVPQRFSAGQDRFLIGDGQGNFREALVTEVNAAKPNYGFGGILTNFDGKRGNELFIANDGDLNHFYQGIPNSKDQPVFTLRETGVLAGCSVGERGYAQACMGIAVGDFDGNKLPDLAVTNFYDEAMNLFTQKRAGLFVDEATSQGLANASKKVLGFGVQSGDWDNDGWLDLTVLNGHLYDARYAGIKFRMAPQVFRGTPSGFTLDDSLTLGDYFKKEQLGRSLAVWDFNRDGKMDCVCNHLDRPSAVLQNETKGGTWLQLQLVGTQSERDAIGATVQINTGSRVMHQWVVSGDGYMSTNEPVLHFGLGKSKVVTDAVVTWPSGTTQTFTGLSPNRRYLLVEEQEIAWNCWEVNHAQDVRPDAVEDSTHP